MLIPSDFTSASPDSRIKPAIAVKSPFSRQAFRVLSICAPHIRRVGELQRRT